METRSTFQREIVMVFLWGIGALQSTYMFTDVENMKIVITFLSGFSYTRETSKIKLIQSINHKTECQLCHTVITLA